MLIEFLDIGLQKFVGLQDASDIGKLRLNREAGLKGANHPFNPPFCLGHTRSADGNA